MWYGNTARYAAGRSFVNSFKWVHYDIFYFVYIVTTIVIALKYLRFPSSDGILSLNDASALSTHCHSPLSCVLMFSGRCITVRPNHRLMMRGVLSFRAGVGVDQKNLTPASTPTTDKTVDSDRLQLRCQLRICSLDKTFWRMDKELWESFCAEDYMISFLTLAH